jgi:small ligand-binding sensory domain FIST
MEDRMHFVSTMTREKDPEQAVELLVEQVRAQIGSNSGAKRGEPALDLLLLFLSAHYTTFGRQIAEGLCDALQPRVLIGCTAENVISREAEIEGEAAISLVAAHLPDVTLTPFSLQPPEWHVFLLEKEEFRRVVGAPEDTQLFILLVDPFSTPVDDILEAFNQAYPGLPTVGGLASGALRPQGNLLILNDQVTTDGLVGVALSGRVDIDLVVSQGCRPIWDPMTITSSQKNVIYDLEGRPPLAMLQELIPELTEDDRALLQNGLFIGRSVVPEGEIPGRGDFLIRGVIGVDWQNGAIAVGDIVQDGEVIQFHLRDAFTAQEDLEMMLIPQMFRDPPGGALLFTCNGRGSRLYNHPDGDISVIHRNLGGPPLAGFFCAGEIGPIGSQNFVHGHTAILALFRQPGKGTA